MIMKKFLIYSKHEARILSFDYMDNMMNVHLQPSVINQKLFSMHDIKPGKKKKKKKKN